MICTFISQVEEGIDDDINSGHDGCEGEGACRDDGPITCPSGGGVACALTWLVVNCTIPVLATDRDPDTSSESQ